MPIQVHPGPPRHYRITVISSSPVPAPPKPWACDTMRSGFFFFFFLFLSLTLSTSHIDFCDASSFRDPVREPRVTLCAGCLWRTTERGEWEDINPGGAKMREKPCGWLVRLIFFDHASRRMQNVETPFDIHQGPSPSLAWDDRYFMRTRLNTSSSFRLSSSSSISSSSGKAKRENRGKKKYENCVSFLSLLDQQSATCQRKTWRSSHGHRESRR